MHGFQFDISHYSSPLFCSWFLDTNMSSAHSHAQRVLSVLNQQRALGKLCDAALSVGEGLVRLAHRNILACFSDMFQDMANVQVRRVASFVLSSRTQELN